MDVAPAAVHGGAQGEFSRALRGGEHQAEELCSIHPREDPAGSEQKAQQIVGGTNMAWGNVVLSENQNDVEACVIERGYEAEIPTCATAESTSSALFSTVASRGSQAMSSKDVNDGFEDIV